LGLELEVVFTDSSDEDVSYSDSEVSTWTINFLKGDRDRRRGLGAFVI
jgi:hypothetical protein